MTTDFENHCWIDVVPADVIAIYRQYARDTFIGAAPALLAVDLYELAYQGGAQSPLDLQRSYPLSCGEFAHAAIAPTRRLFAAARAAGLPIFYTTADTRPDSVPGKVTPTKRANMPIDPADYVIRPEFSPLPGDIIVTKQRASAFYGTPLLAHLTRLGIQTVIVCGESTSGCVRASAVDAYSNGFHVVLAEECCFDRSPISHKINLFDLHHKYADVFHIDAVVKHLEGISLRKAG